jgi:hypothetical protein
MPAKYWQLLCASVATLFFGAPLSLHLLGFRVQAFENRALVAVPALSAGWGVFDQTTRYLIDRMPLRYQAVRANTWIDLHIWDTTPRYGLNGLGGVPIDQALPFAGRAQQDSAQLPSGNRRSLAGTGVVHLPPATADQVAIGLNGWYFLQGVFDRDCTPFIPFREAVSRWEQLLATIRASGRKVVLVVPPDKSTIYPEYVAPNTPNLACSKPGNAEMWRLLEGPAAKRDGIVPIRKMLLAAKRVAGTAAPLYYRTDSHWNSLGSLSFPEATLPTVSADVRVRPSEIVNSGDIRYSGDLLGLLGKPGQEIAPTRRIVRGPSAPVVGDPTVIVGDSYAEAALGQISPYFAHLRLLLWYNNTIQQIVDSIVAAHTVILETVERDFDYKATNGAFITPAFNAQVRRALASHPLK